MSGATPDLSLKALATNIRKTDGNPASACCIDIIKYFGGLNERDAWRRWKRIERHNLIPKWVIKHTFPGDDKRRLPCICLRGLSAVLSGAGVGPDGQLAAMSPMNKYLWNRALPQTCDPNGRESNGVDTDEESSDSESDGNAHSEAPKELEDNLYIMRYINLPSQSNVVYIGRSPDPEKTLKRMRDSHGSQLEILVNFPNRGHMAPLVQEHLAKHRSSTQTECGEWFDMNWQDANKAITALLFPPREVSQ